ncbi:MAG TPA: AraC family transcriptional regulator [Candidatus Limnocylindrales bacterium]|jgi:AraC-like DNA-binding protein
MDDPVGATSIRAWNPVIPGIREVLHATFAEHAYPSHTHDVWTLFVVDEGGVRYDLDGTERIAAPSMVSVLPPHVVHDGRPATGDGYRKRVIYLETSVLGEHLIGPSVDQPVLDDPGLRDLVDGLHVALASHDDALEAEVRLADVAERIRASMGEPAPEWRDARRNRDLAEQLRAWLDDRTFESPTMAEAAAALDADQTQLARAFADAFSIPPHTYVDGRRLGAARARILAGHALADVAAEVGYVDQAHLTRRFKRFLGTTPGRFGERATR